MSLSDQHPGADAIKLSASFPGAARPVRKGEPFTVGVPLPRGRFVPSQAWSIVGLEGPRRSVQTRALDCWSDGSVRWLLVDGNADLSPDSQSVHLIPTTGEVPDVPAIVVTRSGDGVWIDTGAARFHVEPGPHRSVFRRDDRKPAGARSKSERALRRRRERRPVCDRGQLRLPGSRRTPSSVRR